MKTAKKINATTIKIKESIYIYIYIYIYTKKYKIESKCEIIDEL